MLGVANRLRASNQDGEFEREIGWLWAQAGDLVESARPPSAVLARASLARSTRPGSEVEIDSVRSGFANVDDWLTRFRPATAEFVTGFAA